jgi:hypothetical protein
MKKIQLEDERAQFSFRGYNIGQRMIEDFLARSGIGRCSEFRDTAEAVSKVKTTCTKKKAHKS